MSSKPLTFEVAIERILGHEGGYVDHADDPGGETNWGISKRSYPNVDIKALTREGAKEIYLRDFWEPVAKDKLPSITFQMLDAAVSHGMGNTVRMLQRAVNVADDGHWGKHSQYAYANQGENDTLLLFLAERQEFMTKLRTFDSFGRGWMRRIAGNLRFAAADNQEL